MPFMFALGWGLQRLVLNRTLGDDLLVPLLVTFGLSIIIQNGLLLQFSADSRRLSLGALETASVDASAGITIGRRAAADLRVGGAGHRRADAAFLPHLARPHPARHVGLAGDRAAHGRRSAQGLRHRDGHLVRGRDARRRSSWACAPTSIPRPGPARLLYAFEAVVIGGLGSFWGTLAGGVILGVAQTIGATINPEWQQLAGHLVFLAVLLVRPRGLFPRGWTERMTTLRLAVELRHPNLARRARS